MNTNLTSRFFLKTDPVLEEIRIGDDILNLRSLKWWSRVYEYQWMKNACLEYFGTCTDRSAADIATGYKHPGIFLLNQTGFSRVLGTDIVAPEEYEYCNDLIPGTEYMQDNLIDTQITEKFDCVCCISLLEHVMPHFQEQALTNLIKYVRKGGILLLTFDMPGFEYTTDLTLYLKVLRQQRCAVTVEETKEDERISTASSDVADSSLISKNLSCYRIFAEQK